MKNKVKIRKAVFITMALYYIIAIALGVFVPQAFADAQSTVVYFAADWFGWLYDGSVLLMTIVCVWIMFSKVGNIKLGGEKAKPILSSWNWFAICLCGGIATGLVFWGIAEPVTHYMDPIPGLGYEAGTSEAALTSLATTYFHWGFVPYATYAPGAPVIYGSQSTSADMRSLAIATGSPESALCYRYGGIMGKFYDIPVRAGGLMSDAKKWDAQAGYEAMLSFLACEQNGVDVVLQGAGFLDAYLTLSFEKMVSDFQIVDYVDVYLNDIEIDEESVPMEDMQEVGHAGSFIMAESTLDNYSTAILDPIISVRGNKPQDALEQNVEKYIQKAMDAYRSPAIPKECMEEMRKQILAYGIDEAQVKKVEEACVY